MNQLEQHSDGFEVLNRGYNSVFRFGKLSIGLIVPIASYPTSPIPQMNRQIERVKLAEQLGFASVWLRDIPFNVPSFGDVGQTFDPFVYLGFLAAHTNNIALGVASAILPIRHPAQVAKAAASVDVLSDGRLILGVASGDRPQEYPAMNIDYESRAERFRESFQYIRKMHTHNPVFENQYGTFRGDIDMLPKPNSSKIPMLITGGSQQSPDWIAEHGDGWMLYPRDVKTQQRIIEDWRARVKLAGRRTQPIMQSLYFDLASPATSGPKPIHLGFQSGTQYLVEHLKRLEEIGVNHVALNLRFNQPDIETTLTQLAEKVLPEFSIKEQ